MSTIKNIYYFDKAGPTNTKDVVKAVGERFGMGDIQKVLVPVTSGRTAAVFSETLGKEHVVTVDEKEAVVVCRNIADRGTGFFNDIIKSRIDDVMDRVKRRETFDMALFSTCGENWSVARDLLYAFGQGMKVCVQIALVAVETQKIEPGKRVIAVGGDEGGVDTAIVLITAGQMDAFGPNKKGRLKIEEISCMPISK